MSEVVVIGSGLAGMSISRELSRARIAHRLIGPPPRRSFRLGESLDMVGSMELGRCFPELADRLLPKNSARFFLPERTVHCAFRVGGKAKLMFWALLRPTLAGLCHVDRAEFDADAYPLVTQSRWCEPITQTVRELEYDRARDRVEGLVLDDGQRIDCATVFDATNFARLVSRAAGIEATPLDAPRWVAATRYERPIHSPAPTWQTETLVLRTQPELDGIEAWAWWIPMQRRVSIGCSQPLEGACMDAEQAHALTLAAFARRGVELGASWEALDPVRGARTQHCTSPRAFGANWLLAAGACNQVWFPSGTGVGACLAAAVSAPHFVHDPQRVGPAYQRYQAKLLETHRQFQQVYDAGDSLPSGDLEDLAHGLLVSNYARLLEHTLLENHPLRRLGARGMRRLVQQSKISTREFCRVTALVPQPG